MLTANLDTGHEPTNTRVVAAAPCPATTRASPRCCADSGPVLTAQWTPDGQILALKQGMNATIWTFTRNGH
jgi:hypothetical protein